MLFFIYELLIVLTGLKTTFAIFGKNVLFLTYDCTWSYCHCCSLFLLMADDFFLRAG